MIPPDCVKDSLAATGASTGILLIFVTLLAAIGIALLVWRRRSAVVALAVIGLAFASLSAGTPPAQAAIKTAAGCPAGYHKAPVKNADKPAPAPAPVPAPKPAPTTPTPSPTTPAKPVKPGYGTDEESMKPQTTFLIKSNGDSGKELSGENIPNIDVVKKTIRTYYNANAEGIADKTNSPYIKEVKKIVSSQIAKLDELKAATPAGKKPAIVFDVDDTLLWTYDMVDSVMHFNYTSQVRKEYFAKNVLPSIPLMPELVKAAKEKGFTIIGITGRAEEQRNISLTHLEKRYGADTFNTNLFFMKPNKSDNKANWPKYLQNCVKAKCTTVEYKSGTRTYLETPAGGNYFIAANFGDQWSDLQGGHAHESVKLPNPTYYLASPNVEEWIVKDNSAGMDPAQKIYTLKEDGSSGKELKGDDILNIDIAKATVRTYYNADKSGVANKVDSPYIEEVTALAASKATDIAKLCTKYSKEGLKPAATFDADDTTLWTYDMEDGVMKFHFTPEAQKAYLTKNNMPATPGMAALVKKLSDSGCEIIGLTGRSTDLKEVTVKNLNQVGYSQFKIENYYTKYPTGEKPEYVKCAKEKCSTIEYKSSTRKHIDSKAGGGYLIVGNFGDQWSDLKGGYALQHIKLPNPTYYLP